MKKYTAHGGDLDLIEKIYNIPRNEIIDFSGNVNPLGVALSVKKAINENIDLISTYPDVSYEKLRQSIACYTNSEKENIIVGNGSTELISSYIKIIKPKRTLIISPAYSEYEKTARQIKSEVLLFPLEENNNFHIDLNKLIKQIQDNIDLLVICNPNNPTGSYIDENELKEILIVAKENNVFVMVDETYVEFADGKVKICAIPLTKDFDNLYVIRGTSKFFAIPGLRLGYSICSNEEIRDKIKASKDPWSVNILSDIAGQTMFLDTEFIKKTKDLITNERNKFFKELSKNEKIKLFPSQSNFILIKILDDKITSEYIFDNLIKNKMVIRNASDFAYLGNKFIRFCILSPENNDKLIKNLNNIIK